MKISVTFRNTEGDDWHKEYIDQRLKKLEKYVDTPVEARVILSVEKFRNVAEVNLTTSRQTLNSKEEAKEMSLAIDNAVEKIERQLKKHKEKIRGHKGNPARLEGAAPREAYADEAEESLGTREIEIRKVVLKPMSLEDAMMEIDTSKNRFVIYRDSSSERVCIIYVRDDGKYVLIEASS
ncbi:MAG TPA: ribosome-associated translation inhibitor RaiA [Syntrophales bacterium]|nr:ribosome-associated translation inhibitor RaiA [Syntrophales bacterium]